jgi:adenine-specific DNA-methyltransferase
MRYIGSKKATLPVIQSIIAAHAPNAASLCDPFAGTCTVARHFKGLGLRVETGDLLWGSYTFQLATIALNREPSFAQLLSILGRNDAERPVGPAAETVLSWLACITPKTGYMTENFSEVGASGRWFFTRESANQIDAIREQIAAWRDEGLVDEMEEAYLLACLLDAADRVANTAGTYMAHLKSWGRKALRPLELRPIQIVDNRAQNRCSRADARQTAATDVDVLYLDPPYNTRDYSFYYHLPETLVLWDGVTATGKSGVPVTRRHPISDFCVRARAATALRELLDSARADFIVVHYAADGLIRHDEIVSMLEYRGKVGFEDLQVRSYSSKNGGDQAKAHHRIYWCRAN